MKLNNKGWGTTEMLLLSAGIILALLVAVYFISKLYGSFDASISNKMYSDIETNLASAAKKYVIENNISVDNGELTIYSDTLQALGYIGNLEDNCKGFVVVNKVDFDNTYKAYITCNNYMTKNLAN